MRSVFPYVVFVAGPLLGLACGGFDLSRSDDGSSTFFTGGSTTGTGGTGGSIDPNIGGTMSPEGFDYSGLCGRGCELGEDCAIAADRGTGGGGEAGADTSEAEALVCRLIVDSETSQVEKGCAPAGEAPELSPCLDSSDCGPGLGCVDSGVCRAYCCDDLESCQGNDLGDTFCAPRPLAQGDVYGIQGETPLVPVCVPVQHCVLLDDYTCPSGQTCTIVKSDGTVSCVIPGEGTAGEGCPCAAGFACKPGINTCYQLCRADRPDDCPGGFTCQGGVASYPDGFGVCIEN